MTRQQSIDATWRAEALQPLAWALGLLDDVGPPNALCDVARLQAVLPALGEVVAPFVTAARLRADEELLEANETVYQQHWEARDAQLDNKPSTINIEVVQERHLGLNWVIGYEGLEWDEVTTDT